MAAPTWPNTLPVPSVGTKESLSYPALRHEFAAGYQYTAAKWTRARRRMSLNWNFMTEDQYADLEDFFVEAQGQAFSFTHPRTNTTMTVIIMSDEITCGFGLPGGRTDVTLEIAER